MVKIEIEDELLDDTWDDIEYKLAHLLLEDVIFCNSGSLHVNCNDIFAWGCADAEDVLYKEIKELYAMWKKGGWGSAAWCIKKRKMMPQAPVEKRIREEGIWNLEELISEKNP